MVGGGGRVPQASELRAVRGAGPGMAGRGRGLSPTPGREGGAGGVREERVAWSAGRGPVPSRPPDRKRVGPPAGAAREGGAPERGRCVARTPGISFCSW